MGRENSKNNKLFKYVCDVTFVLPGLCFSVVFVSCFPIWIYIYLSLTSFGVLFCFVLKSNLTNSRMQTSLASERACVCEYVRACTHIRRMRMHLLASCLVANQTYIASALSLSYHHTYASPAVTVSLMLFLGYVCVCVCVSALVRVWLFLTFKTNRASLPSTAYCNAHTHTHTHIDTLIHLICFLLASTPLILILSLSPLTNILD